jgi:hypothetical protein
MANERPAVSLSAIVLTANEVGEYVTDESPTCACDERVGVGNRTGTSNVKRRIVTAADAVAVAAAAGKRRDMSHAASTPKLATTVVWNTHHKIGIS